MPFADGRFPTPSGKVELRCEAVAALGLDPLPDYEPPAEFVAGLGARRSRAAALVLISGASHHFVTTSMANQPGLVAKEGTPFIEINPDDAAARQSSTARTSSSRTSAAGARCAPSSPTTCRPAWPSPPKAAGPRSPPTAATSTGSPPTPSPTSPARAPPLQSGPRPPGDRWPSRDCAGAVLTAVAD